MVYVFDKVDEYDMSLSELLEICGDIKVRKLISVNRPRVAQNLSCR